MLKPLTQFYCDCCGEIIQEPKHGWVEWLTVFDPERGDYIFKGHRIVHHIAYSPRTGRDCYTYKKHIGRSDIYLTDFLDKQTGIAEMLRFIDCGPIHEPQFTGHYLGDLREYIEFIRRLTIPYYEEARLYWPRPSAITLLTAAARYLFMGRVI
jgi:hypothetical protein